MGLLKEIFSDQSLTVTLPSSFGCGEGEIFMTISHHMMMHGKILMKMLPGIISKINNEPAWQVLGSLKYSILSKEADDCELDGSWV
jgi:hypothetical protein